MAVAPVARNNAPAYIAPDAITDWNDTLNKVAIFGMILGAGLLLAALYGAVHWLVGAGVFAISFYAYTCIQEARGGYALWEAAVDGKRDVVQWQLYLGANPNVIIEGYNPLTSAAFFGHADILNDLLDAGGNPNVTNGADRTPLVCAISKSQDAVVRVLLERGADVDGTTPAQRARANNITREESLVNAIEAGDRKAVQDLLQLGVNLNEKGQCFFLWRAVSHGHAEILSDLIAAGCDVNMRDPYNETTLLQAIRGMHEECVTVLLLHDADPKIETQNCKGDIVTPYTYALTRVEEYRRDDFSDFVCVGDKRTRAERKRVAENIVKHLELTNGID